MFVQYCVFAVDAVVCIRCESIVTYARMEFNLPAQETRVTYSFDIFTIKP